MGSAVGQVPEYIEMVVRWCKQNTRMPVITKLTPNITDIRKPARAAKAGGTDAVSLINTINSITAVDLDTFAPEPTDRRQGQPWRLLRPGGQADRAEHGGRDRPRPRDARPADLRHRRHHHLARRGRVHGARRRQRAGLHRGHDLRLQDRPGDDLRPRRTGWTRRATPSLDDIVGRAMPNVTDWQYLNLNYIAKARIDQDACIKCGRCHIACEDTSHQAITQHGRRQAPFRGDRGRSASAAISASTSARSRTASPWSRWRPASSTSAPASRCRRSTPTGPASEQSDGEGGGGVGTPQAGRSRRLRCRTNQARRPAGLLFGDAMPGDLSTRTATTGDIGVLVALNAFVQALHAEAHPDIFIERPDPAPVSGWFAAAIADPKQRVWLAELDGNTAGYLVLRVIRRPTSPFKFADAHGLIDQIAIDPKARRRRAWSCSYRTARCFLRDQGITRMRAEHWAFNQDAAAFFAGEGLEPLSHQSRRSGGPLKKHAGPGAAHAGAPISRRNADLASPAIASGPCGAHCPRQPTLLSAFEDGMADAREASGNCL